MVNLGFESTYEELKPEILKEEVSIEKFWVYLWGIETNNYDNEVFYTPIRFESTYEELKPKHNVLKVKDTLKFWVYLWGIETSFLRNFFPHVNMVLSLPMRNWNQLSDSRYFTKNSFESTYEELKLF